MTVELAAEQAIVFAACSIRYAWMRARSPVSSAWTLRRVGLRASAAGRQPRFFERPVGGERETSRSTLKTPGGVPWLLKYSGRLRAHLDFPAQAAVGAIKCQDRALSRLDKGRAVVEQAVTTCQGPGTDHAEPESDVAWPVQTAPVTITALLPQIASCGGET